MGHKRPKKVYRVEVDDGPDAGFWMRVRSVPTGQLMKIIEMSQSATTDTASAGRLFEAFAAALVEWNLEDDGPDGEDRPVPATLDGLYSQDFDFALDLVMRWQEAIAGVPPPLPGASSSGGTSLEASLPMEPLSPSRPS